MLVIRLVRLALIWLKSTLFAGEVLDARHFGVEGSTTAEMYQIIPLMLDCLSQAENAAAGRGPASMMDKMLLVVCCSFAGISTDERTVGASVGYDQFASIKLKCCVNS